MPGRIARLAMLTIAAALSACAVSPTSAPPPNPAVEAARQAQATGDPASAARLWLDAAANAPTRERDGFLLLAAEAWSADGEMARSADVLRQIDESMLDSASVARFHLLRAEQALAGGDAGSARFFLEAARPGLPPAQRARYRQLEDSVIRLQAGPSSQLLAQVSAALARMRASDPGDALELLVSLDHVSSGRLNQVLAEVGPASLAATWLELCLRIREGLLSRDGLPRAAGRWASGHPAHTVDEAGFMELARRYGARFPPPPRVAVLLPQQGGLGSAGTAIRDGIVHAFMQDMSRSELKFFETGESVADAIGAYRRALQYEADWVIGPLRKEAVEALAGQPADGVPILALNSAGETFPVNTSLVSVSLSQEDDAASVAEQLVASGLGRVITLTAANPRGERMTQAFERSFTEGGGHVSGGAKFNPDSADHSPLLTDLLEIDASRQRRDSLQSLLGQSLNFEPHLKNDFDAFFLGTGPELARQIKPQLKFYGAGGKPVFATSRIFSGTLNRTADRDLDGIRFPIAPALLDHAATGLLPPFESVRGGSLLNLFALGVDAWRLVRWLPLMQLDPDLAFAGETGALKLSPRGKLDRSPAWAVFEQGRPGAADLQPGAE